MSGDRYGLLGWPLAHSASPAMHEAAFAALGIDATYELMPTRRQGLPGAVAMVRQGELAGANVTIPHKLAAAALCDVLEPAARAVGAVNTLWPGPSGVRGDNTDVAGFAAALDLLPVGAGCTVLVLGAGGAARAAAHVLAGRGHAVVVVARRPENAQWFAGRAAVAAWTDGPVHAQEGVGLLVNATPIGGPPYEGQRPWPDDVPLPPCPTLDLVAWPRETRLVGEQRARGIPASGGLPMLVAQAEASFCRWTGTPPPQGLMARAARAAAPTRAA